MLKNAQKLPDSSISIHANGSPQQKKIINKKAHSPTYTNQNKTISIAPQKLKRQKEMKEKQMKDLKEFKEMKQMKELKQMTELKQKEMQK